MEELSQMTWALLGELLTSLYFCWFIDGLDFIFSYGLSLPVFLEINEASIMGLIEEAVFIHFAHFISCKFLFLGVTVSSCLGTSLAPADIGIEIQRFPGFVLGEGEIVKLLLVEVDVPLLRDLASGQHLAHVYRLGLFAMESNEYVWVV